MSGWIWIIRETHLRWNILFRQGLFTIHRARMSEWHNKVYSLSPLPHPHHEAGAGHGPDGNYNQSQLTEHIAIRQSCSDKTDRQTDRQIQFVRTWRILWPVQNNLSEETRTCSWQLWLDEWIVYWLKILITSLMSALSRTINKMEQSDHVSSNFTMDELRSF